MAKRVRSPNYPAISLADAIERLEKLGNEIHSHPAPRDLVLTGMGYSGANGASLTALAALGKYGLLEREGEDFKITERGMMYLHPESDEERRKAVRDAATEPKLFAELNERFTGEKPGDGLIRNYLLRKKFTPSAASNALLSYRETMEFMEGVCGDEYLSGDVADEESASMEQQLPGTTISARTGGNPVPCATTTVSPGQFRVSMTDEFFVDVSASKLNRSGVKRLKAWLDANEELVPDE